MAISEFGFNRFFRDLTISYQLVISQLYLKKEKSFQETASIYHNLLIFSINDLNKI